MYALLLCVGVCACVGVGGVEVRVSGGVVRGVKRLSYDGRDYHAFLAIPYAQPPTGTHRFMPPQPGVSWEGVLQAGEDAPPCAQAALGITGGVEDCLNLYVYTPKLPGVGVDVGVSGPLPVVVWVPGGGFVVGGAASLDEYLLMDRDVVVVVPQYRLGLLGYLHTPTGTSTGNVGMLDQVAALQWVQDNIGAFGGDRTQVTLAGDCSGGASAIYHMLSPLSKGLFHRVISLSGSPLNPWALYQQNHRFLLILANYIKCPAHDQNLLVQCFQEIEVEELLEAVQMLLESRDLLVGNHRLAPAVQNHTLTPTHALFLPAHPLHLLSHAPATPVPVLMGLTKNVGTYLVDMLLYDFILYKMEDDETFLTKLLPMLLKESLINNYTSRQQEFQDYYFDSLTWDNLTAILPPLAQMLGDIHYRAGVVNTASLLSQHVTTWVMRYEYTGGPSLFHHRHPSPPTAPPLPPTAGHGDEMALLLPDQRYTYTPEQRRAATHLLNILENFAYGRAPREDWPIFTAHSQESLVFTEEGHFITQPFASENHREMLNHIHSYLHYHAINDGSSGSGSSDSSSSSGSGSGSGGGGGDGGGRDEL